MWLGKCSTTEPHLSCVASYFSQSQIIFLLCVQGCLDRCRSICSPGVLCLQNIPWGLELQMIVLHVGAGS